MGQLVSVDNFARAESDRMFAGMAAGAGGVNRWSHSRVPVPLDEQTVIRLNRDTLYSIAIVDVTAGATLSLPDAGHRYLSAMILDQDHYVTAIFHGAGDHRLPSPEQGTPHVLVAVRAYVDPYDPQDVAVVAGLQDQYAISAGSAAPFQAGDYDEASLTRTRTALLELARGLPDMHGCFGARNAVEPVRHLIGAASGWGGLPEHEAMYLNIEPHLPVGSYELTVREVPVDGFWSLTVYDADGFMPIRGDGAVSVNDVTAVRDPDGAVTIRLGGPAGADNLLRLVDGWNYMVRFYRPRSELLDGTWTFPSLRVAAGPERPASAGA